MVESGQLMVTFSTQITSPCKCFLLPPPPYTSLYHTNNVDPS